MLQCFLFFKSRPIIHCFHFREAHFNVTSWQNEPKEWDSGSVESALLCFHEEMILEWSLQHSLHMFQMFCLRFGTNRWRNMRWLGRCLQVTRSNSSSTDGEEGSLWCEAEAFRNNVVYLSYAVVKHNLTHLFWSTRKWVPVHQTYIQTATRISHHN